MNLQNIISEIEKVDPEVYDRLDTRRKAMKKFANLSGKVALASLPIAFGSMLNTAYGRESSVKDIVIDTLNFALTLEYLEAAFYNKIVTTAAFGTASSSDQTALKKIQADENAHVAFLKGALGAQAVASPTFDLTGGKGSGNGPFKGYDLATGYPVVLAMSQTFEDTGVRAYKGQAPNLQSSRPYLTAALEIHSVEARHAAKVRQMRRVLNAAIPASQMPLKPWITQNYSGIDYPAAQANINLSYAGEENVSQAGVTITGIGGNSFITANAASEAFDEPLTKAQVLTIVDPFIV